MLLRLLSLITGRRIVLLETYYGKVYRSLERKTEFGKHIAPVYPITNIGCVILNDDGTIGKESPTSYIVRWKYLKEPKKK